jgi:DNA-nicking Smr family endonuclease
MRRLSDAERMLWGEVVRDIVPLRPPLLDNGTAGPAAESLADPAPQAPAPRKHLPPLPKPDRPPPLAPFGRRLRQRIARGSSAIGGRLDLHGLTQREAHDALLRFLRAAQERGATLVLVITGKGVPSAEVGSERGVLKRQVPHWLRLPAFRDLIVGFEPAHVTHGGEGALYIRLRKARQAK